MRKVMVALGVTVILLGVASPSHAWLRVWYRPYPYWYPYPVPYVYAPPPAVVRAAAPVVIQQQPQQQYWYYCREANGYYPSVQQCPSGWVQVLPQATPPTGPR
jgi:hypothetical protein